MPLARSLWRLVWTRLLDDHGSGRTHEAWQGNSFQRSGGENVERPLCRARRILPNDRNEGAKLSSIAIVSAAGMARREEWAERSYDLVRTVLGLEVATRCGRTADVIGPDFPDVDPTRPSRLLPGVRP